jgi:hypothetical protein
VIGKGWVHRLIWGVALGHSSSAIWNPKATLYETNWIQHGRCDSHLGHSGSCIWNPKATLYEKYWIPENQEENVTSPRAGNGRGEDWALAASDWIRLGSVASKARFEDQCVTFGVH